MSASRADPLGVASPDGRVAVEVRLTDRLYYNLMVDGQEVMWFSPLSMRTSQGDFGVKPKLRHQQLNRHNGAIETAWGQRNVVRDHYQELQLDFEGGYSVLFRAYDDGVAYRFRSTTPGELVVHGEEVEYRFDTDFGMVNHVVDDFQTSYEKYYTRQPISAVQATNLVSLPAIVVQPQLKLAITEADLFDYPGFYLTRQGTHNRHTLAGAFPAYPLAWEAGGWGHFNLKVTERAKFIARTRGQRDFPWRVLAVAREDKDLLDSDLVYKLARPAAFDASWVKPGKVAWDWWNAINLTGVDFKTGINNQSYEYFIDFAARHGIEYVILDEGWSDQFDVLLPTPLVDMEHLTKYARERGVRLILWAVWYTMDRQYEEAFALFEKWGVAGVKVDFIDRDDQLAIEFYERLVKAAAKHKLLVDYHGCSKPTGLHRTYPNLINYEAVLGNEYNKFSAGTPPDHNVNIPFTRMLAGPLDYTPGAMTNSIQGDFRQSFTNPMSHGTRMHQIAMFVVYYSPLQMLCDAPTAYEPHPAILQFLSAVPTTWDETVALDGVLGEYVVIARRQGKDWFIGGMTNWTGRSVEIDLSRFATGRYTARLLVDSVNAHRAAGDYQAIERVVSATDRLPVTMQPGGGFAIHLRAE
jgi:alpha-glucosidase